MSFTHRDYRRVRGKDLKGSTYLMSRYSLKIIMSSIPKAVKNNQQSHGGKVGNIHGFPELLVHYGGDG